MVAAAVGIGAAVVGAAGSVAASNKAASATKSATNASIQQQQQALAQQAQLSAPYRGLGESAIPQLQNLLGLAPTPQQPLSFEQWSAQNPAATPPPAPKHHKHGLFGGGFLGGLLAPSPSNFLKGQIDPAGAVYSAYKDSKAGAPVASDAQSQYQQYVSDFQKSHPAQAQADPTTTLRNTPGYQFARDQGLQGVTNSATAQGLSLSGNTLEALDKYGTGLADQTYQEAVGNLENVAGLGQAAAAGQAANIGNAARTNSSALINQGNTLAGIGANEIAGITRSIGNAADQYGQYQTLQGLNSPAGISGFDPEDSNAAINSQIGYPAPIDVGGP